MSKYIKETENGPVPMTPEEEAYWDSVLAEDAAKEALRNVGNPELTIPTTTV
jgi:hypothetical protein